MINKDIPIGTKVYLEEYWTGRIVKAKIVDFEIYKGKDYAKLEGLFDCDDDEDTDTIGSFGGALENLYLTKEEAINSLNDKNNKEVEEYKETIKSIEDLVVFCLDNCVANAEEYTNWNARRAAIEKAKEYGIDIEN